MLLLILLGIVLVVIIIYKQTIKDDDDDDFEYTESSKPSLIAEVTKHINTPKPTSDESDDDYSQRILKAMAECYEYEEKRSVKECGHNRKYFIAGLKHYVIGPFVTYGVAVRIPNHPYSSRAVGLFDHAEKFIGYIPEAILDVWYEETKGEPTPVVMRAMRSEGALIGEVYTFHQDASSYPQMLALMKELFIQHGA